jgi:hypothetical protein
MTEFDERFNGFGAPVHVPDYFHLVGELGHSLSEDSVSDLSEVVKEWTYRMMVAEATGRWRFRGGRAEPSRLVPGDVVALSALYAAGVVGERSDDGSPALYPEGTSVARRVLDARHFWLPANTVEAVLSSDRPDASMLPEVRLPHRCCAVWFAQAAQIPPGAVPDVSAVVASLATFIVRHEQPMVAAFAALDRLRGGEGWLEGVLLNADESGHLDDRVAWFVRDGPAGKVSSRTVLFGRVSDADWAAVVEVLAAVVAWGDWTAPERLAPIAWGADRAARRQLRRGRTRIVEEAGGLSNVVVLDARRRAPPGDGPGEGTHASPITHLRRGHFRRVPVGPRDQQRREVRWIPPTVVNPLGPGGDTIRVYRLPPKLR